MNSRLEGKTITSVHYTNDKHDAIEVLIQRGTNQSPYHIGVNDKNQADIKYLHSIGWTFEKIYESTLHRNRGFHEAFQRHVQVNAEKQLQEMKEEYESKIEKIRIDAFSNGALLIDALMESNKDSKRVREAKLSALNNYELDKEQKISIRNSSSLIEIYEVLHESVLRKNR